MNRNGLIGTWLNGSLTSTTPIVQQLTDAVPPTTITLESSAAGRKIELSTNNGVEYFTPQYDQTSTTMLVVTLQVPVTHVRITGQANDTWSVD